jgi:predicted AlkP superfamily pyrophosphatase or phosphodiesterase
MMRRSTLLLACAALSLSASCATAQGGRQGPVKPRLIVHLSIDQLRPDYLDVYGGEFAGGLARLLRGGAYFQNGYQDHAVTETAPGHSTMMSGRFPRSTGIVENDRGVLDAESPLIAGARGEPASPYRFRGSTLGDWLRFADSRARLLSISRKDRAAILPLGRAKGEAYWYAPLSGFFTTSRWYADTLPSWVQRFNARQLPQSYAGKTWNLLALAARYAEPDSNPLEALGKDYLFPHVFPDDVQQAALLLIHTPMMDELTAQLALEGVNARELGAMPGRTDFLAVSFSSTDAVGHKYGPDSRELHDQMLRLDRTLGVFIDSLYKLRDSSTIVFSLTSDHGVAPFPDGTFTSRYRKAPAGRTTLRPVTRALYDSLARRGVDTAGYRVDVGVLYLDSLALARAHVNRDSVARAYVADMSKLEGVLRADLYADLAKRDTTRDVIARRWLHMFPPDLPVMAVVTLKPFWTWRGVLTANHGTPHDYDARVPVLFYGAGIRPGRSNDAVRVVDIAPTLAALLEIRPEERLDGHVLTRVIR